jgi:hypothetical protein
MTIELSRVCFLPFLESSYIHIYKSLDSRNGTGCRYGMNMEASFEVEMIVIIC